MVASSLPEIYTLVYGWFLFERIWDVIVTTGLFWIPFIVAIIKISLEARNAGSYAGNVGLLAVQRIETQCLSMLFVIMFACIPFKQSGFSLSVSTVNYQNNINECSVDTRPPIPTNIRNAFADVEGQMVYMPIFWGAVHSLSAAVVNAFTVALPCKDDIAFNMFQLNESQIQDRDLKNEINDFHDACYVEAKYRLSGTGTTPSPNDTDWLGSSFFMNTTGYYDDIRIGPLDGWASDSRFTDPLQPDLIYRSCKDYWLDGSQGIEQKVIDTLEPGLVDSIMNGLYQFLGAEDTVEEKKRAMVQSVLAVTAVKDLGGDFDASFSDQYYTTDTSGYNLIDTATAAVSDWTVATVGASGRFLALAGKNITSYTEKFIYRESQYYLLAIIKMVLIVTIPIILLLSGFGLKSLAICGVGYFALQFINFIWAFAFWLETTWMEALRTNSLTDPNNAMLLNIISNTVYIVLPIAWIAILSWSGYSLIGALKLDEKNQSNAASMGNTAGNAVNPVNYAGGAKTAALGQISKGLK